MAIRPPARLALVPRRTRLSDRQARTLTASQRLARHLPLVPSWRFWRAYWSKPALWWARRTER